jgi:hypothetical protein
MEIQIQNYFNLGLGLFYVTLTSPLVILVLVVVVYMKGSSMGMAKKMGA